MKLLDEPLYIELIALAVLLAVLVVRGQVRRMRGVDREPLDQGLLRGICQYFEGRPEQARETLEALPRSDLRDAWMARIAHDAKDYPRALDLLRGARRITPESVLLEYAAIRGEAGGPAADELLAQARQLPDTGLRSAETKLRVFAGLESAADLAEVLPKVPVGLPSPVLARAATAAIAAGHRIPDSVFRKHGLPLSIAVRAQSVSRPELRRALLEDFDSYARCVTWIREDLRLPEDPKISQVWLDLQALEPMQQRMAREVESRETAAAQRPQLDTPGVGGLEALADGPFERLVEALHRWSAAPLRGPLAETLCQVAERRGPRLLDEIRSDARCRANLDRVRLAALALAVHPPSRDPSVLSGFARLELAAAVWVLPADRSLKWFVARPDDLWPAALEHPRPVPLTLLRALVEAPLASRALGVLRARTDLLAEALTGGLDEPSNLELVEHLARTAPAEVSASLLRRLLSQEDVHDRAYALFGCVGRDAIAALMSCIGSEALETRALRFAPSLSDDARALARQLAQDAEAHGDRRSAMFLSRLGAEQTGGGR